MIKHLLHTALVAAVLGAPLLAQAQSTDAPGLPQLPADPPTNTVPEPGSMALAGMAMAGLLVAGRRQQRAQAQARHDAD